MEVLVREFFLVILLPLSLAAQSNAPRAKEINFGFSENGPRYGGDYILNAPFSATLVKERSQTLANGTRVTRKPSSVAMFRDTAGRTRAEWPIAIGSSGPSSPVIVQIEDPSAGFEYVIDHQHRTTHRLAIARKTPVLDQGPPAPPANRPAAAPGRPQFTVEDLGTKTVEGRLAQGHRETRVDPAGFDGNDGPVTTVRETWWSFELRMNIIVNISSPVTGDDTIRLIGITLGEPSPSLFQPHPDYTLIEESGPFVLRLVP
jgi:hypothetical protein